MLIVNLSRAINTCVIFTYKYERFGNKKKCHTKYTISHCARVLNNNTYDFFIFIQNLFKFGTLLECKFLILNVLFVYRYLTIVFVFVRFSGKIDQ